MRIAFVVPEIDSYGFTGGLLCVLEHANELRRRGHDTRIVSVRPARTPKFIDLEVPIDGLQGSVLLRERARVMRSTWISSRGRSSKHRLVRVCQDLIGSVDEFSARTLPYALRRGVELARLRRLLPEVDVTVATHYTTLLPAFIYGYGGTAYFMQHYEVLTQVAKDSSDPLPLAEAQLSYRLPVTRIANSSWLRDYVQREHGYLPELCFNAIDHDTFFPQRADATRPRDFTVISYGGRGVEWKGFREAAEAIKIARETIGEVRWLVFGSADLPPSNDIAPYEPLGFITGDALRHAYWQADAILCPAWYESFPLYPLEAMASGVAVITTPSGTEDYALDGDTAIVVPPRDPVTMANALTKIHDDRVLRGALVSRGVEIAKSFTWERAGATMEAILQRCADMPVGSTEHES